MPKSMCLSVITHLWMQIYFSYGPKAIRVSENAPQSIEEIFKLKTNNNRFK